MWVLFIHLVTIIVVNSEQETKQDSVFLKKFSKFLLLFLHSVSCGTSHTLIITTYSNLWSCGYNKNGQLCHGDTEDRLKPQKTLFSNISQISAGWYHSLFQNDKGEIFACGYNQQGECGLGHFIHPQITPRLILNAPENNIHFVCGSSHSLFLDSEGNVFDWG